MIINIFEWLKNNKFTHIIKKTKLMLFTILHAPDLPNIYSNKWITECVDEYKYLGVWIKNRVFLLIQGML